MYKKKSVWFDFVLVNLILFWPHLMLLRGYCWLWTQELLLIGLGGTMWQAGDQSQVDSDQGKYLYHWTIAPAPHWLICIVFYFLYIFHPGENRIMTMLCRWAFSLKVCFSRTHDFSGDMTDYWITTIAMNVNVLLTFKKEFLDCLIFFHMVYKMNTNIASLDLVQ